MQCLILLDCDFHLLDQSNVACFQADRLLDLGFEKKMEEILSIIDKRLEQARTGPRQTVLMSATMHSNLTRLATLSLQQPVKIGFRSGTPFSVLTLRHKPDSQPTSECDCPVTSAINSNP